jgi:1-deoxy-D-xylulose-5-phosphate reductoisomerase
MESLHKVLLLGASGSIGSQTIDIINEAKDKFTLTAFSVGKNYEKALKILRNFPSVKHVYVIDKEKANELKKEFPNVKVFFGEKGLAKLTKAADYTMCVDALVGFAGMEPAIIALKKDKILCLANKEALVTGGQVINMILGSGKGKLYPIDSEHVALAKCLAACKPGDVKRLIITASGGALRNVPLNELENVKAEQALQHPTWKMGNKITIDCATMMNKGFEIIEAAYLYGYPLDKITVMMHDESLVHSAVELNDGSFIIDFGKPDMHKPIKWAMYEGQVENDVKKIKSFSELKDCHFHEYDANRYPCTELAKKALLEGPSKMIALNAANEVLVNKYLNDEIKFTDIAKGVQLMVDSVPAVKYAALPLIKFIDKFVRKETERCLIQ